MKAQPNEGTPRTTCPFEEVISAKEHSGGDVESFFEDISQVRDYDLFDLGTPEYDEFIRVYGEMKADRIGDDEGTMATLISQAQSELEQHIPALNIGIAQQIAIDEFCNLFLKGVPTSELPSLAYSLCRVSISCSRSTKCFIVSPHFLEFIILQIIIIAGIICGIL